MFSFLRPLVLKKGDFAPQGHLTISGDISRQHDLGRATGIQRVEAGVLRHTHNTQDHP